MFKKGVACFLIVVGAVLFTGVYSIIVAAQEADSQNLTIDSYPDDFEPGPSIDNIELDVPPVGKVDNRPLKDGKPFLPGTGHDGPELKAFFDSLELSPEERYQNEAHLVDNVYNPLFKRLSLPEDKQNRFRDLLVEIRISWNDMEEEVRKSGTSEEEIEKGLKKMGEAAWELDKQVEQFLGVLNYKKYNEYKSSLGIFMTDAIDELEESLSEETQISKSQESRLVSAMAEEFENFISSKVGKMEGPPSYRVEMRDKEVQKKINANIDYLKSRYIEQAKLILNGVQLSKYRKVIEEKINTRKSFSEDKVKEIEELEKTKKPVLYRDFRDS